MGHTDPEVWFQELASRPRPHGCRTGKTQGASACGPAARVLPHRHPHSHRRVEPPETERTPGRWRSGAVGPA
jgi:hypothetical protein